MIISILSSWNRDVKNMNYQALGQFKIMTKITMERIKSIYIVKIKKIYEMIKHFYPLNFCHYFFCNYLQLWFYVRYWGIQTGKCFNKKLCLNVVLKVKCRIYVHISAFSSSSLSSSSSSSPSPPPLPPPSPSSFLLLLRTSKVKGYLRDHKEI